MNRILQAIADVNSKMSGLAADKLTVADEAAVLTFKEWAAMNDARALAQASGTITYDESQTLADILGIATPTTFAGATLAQRIVAMKCCQELLGAQIAGFRRSPVRSCAFA